MRADGLREELKRKIVAWIISFHHLDPRYKILTFFNEVAQEGADGFCNDGDEEDDARGSHFDQTGEEGEASRGSFGRRPTNTLSAVEKLVRDAFNTTSIVTVWRPTSNTAMRRMMEGAGVGKGLDIKGKSAKRGELSAYVPFMQIHADEDKHKIREISGTARLRFYLTSEQARADVRDLLATMGNDNESDPDQMMHGEMIELNDFVARGFWGLEMSQRLFWKGLVEDANIERDADTETGRRSMPEFQDANLATLKKATEKNPAPSPMPVVLQYSRDDPFSPQHLLMAYEENGTISPVVSDFDGFLLGWRREALWFGCVLPDEQIDLMVWCVNQIEEVLDDRRNKTHANSAAEAGWTQTWLNVLERNSDVHPDFPPYGFGDPKSYGIMEQAALRLLDTGAVRHGAECFNYYFPQEIDESFLIVSDMLKPVPWKYVNETELQQILSQHIKEGFVFPLNPKWILCDRGWKAVYDQLMASDALYADYAKDVWYPPYSGVREKIERICKNHPGGFLPDPNEVLNEVPDEFPDEVPNTESLQQEQGIGRKKSRRKMPTNVKSLRQSLNVKSLKKTIFKQGASRVRRATSAGSTSTEGLSRPRRATSNECIEEKSHPQARNPARHTVTGKDAKMAITASSTHDVPSSPTSTRNDRRLFSNSYTHH